MFGFAPYILMLLSKAVSSLASKAVIYPLFLAGILFTGSLFLTAAQNGGNKNIELVHAGDILRVDVVGTAENDWNGGLTPEGFLDGANPYGDPVMARCRTTEAIAADLSAIFSKYLRDPKVEVTIIDRSNRATAVLDGAVKTPSRFQIRRSVTLRELIVLAGGITDMSSGKIRIIHPEGASCNSRPKSETDSGTAATDISDINVSDLIDPKGKEIEIFSGDLINVIKAEPIYILGGVANPRPIAMRGTVTLTRAVAMAGGLLKDASPGDVFIYRRNGSESTVVQSDLTEIEAGTLPDPPLAAYDIIDVGRKGYERAKVRPEIEISAAQPTNLPLKIIE